MSRSIILGFKAFNKGLINKYGNIFEINKVYSIKDDIKYASKGYHMCKNLEDTLKYYDTFSNEIDICLVLGFGEYQEYYDDYYGYYDMYSFQNIILINKLSRNEIINYMLKQSEDRIIRFVSLYKMNEDEYNQFRNITDNIDNYIDYYQLDKKDVFKKKYSK